MVPIFDERPWGVRDLRPLYTRVIKEPIGESWLTWEDNRVANGPLAGRTLASLSKEFRRDLVGQLSCYEDRFPLLVKFLFPGDKLSVQVHPDDAQARKDGFPCGKTECWYVLQAEPGAQVALGLKPGVTLDQFRDAIQNTRAEELLNWLDVFAGDMLYVAAGTVHTIGGGMILVETQQTSDVTYRLYDYGRPRQIHVAEGLAATRLHTNAGKVVRAGSNRRKSGIEEARLQPCHDAGKVGGASAPEGSLSFDLRSLPQAASHRRDGPADTAGSKSSADANDDSVMLVRSPYFQVEKLRLRDALQTAVSAESPHIIVAIEGAGVVESRGMEPISFNTGDAVVVPACVREYTVRPQWELELMRMSLPTGQAPEPHTILHRAP
jgi:mannose-6-phosphate isomerase